MLTPRPSSGEARAVALYKTSLIVGLERGPGILTSRERPPSPARAFSCPPSPFFHRSACTTEPFREHFLLKYICKTVLNFTHGSRHIPMVLILAGFPCSKALTCKSDLRGLQFVSLREKVEVLKKYYHMISYIIELYE